MIKERLAALRALMKEKGVWACIVPGTDPHASEYMAEHWTEMSWITGFLGETGTAVITTDQALLWTDSRYYLQAEAELQGTTVELMRESDIDCPSIPEWLCKARGERREARVADVQRKWLSRTKSHIERRWIRVSIYRPHLTIVDRRSPCYPYLIALRI